MVQEVYYAYISITLVESIHNSQWKQAITVLTIVKYLICIVKTFCLYNVVQCQGADMCDRTHMHGNVKQRDGWQKTQTAVSNMDAHGRKLTD